MSTGLIASAAAGLIGKGGGQPWDLNALMQQDQTTMQGTQQQGQNDSMFGRVQQSPLSPPVAPVLPSTNTTGTQPIMEPPSTPSGVLPQKQEQTPQKQYSILDKIGYGLFSNPNNALGLGNLIMGDEGYRQRTQNFFNSVVR